MYYVLIICLSFHCRFYVIDTKRLIQSANITSSSFWNFFVKKLKIPNPHEIALSVLKYNLKNYILINQNSGDPDQ